MHLSGSGEPAAEAELAEALGFDLVAVDRDELNGHAQAWRCGRR